MEARRRRAAWLFMSPALVLLAVFFVVPVVVGLALSLTDFDLYAIASPGSVRFTGLARFVEILRDGEFWNALRNTLYFVIVGGPLSVATSLGAAILLNEKLVKARGLFRTVYFAPVLTTLVSVAIVWRYLYHPSYGLLNSALAAIGIQGADWLGDPRWAMPAIILLAIWKNFGYNMLIFVAGLQAIPEQLYEAAAIDGASARQRFRHITLPGLAPTFFFVGVTTMIGYFQIFAEPYVMTQGGPVGSTRTLVLHMYEEGFRWWRMGEASALAVILLLITLVGALIQIRVAGGRR
jgi:multiple sugar transport system permease protein